MMNRFFDTLCVDERRRIYYEMVRYWRGVLRLVKPAAIIFPNMPHFVYDYIIYELAHIFGIKTILFDDTRFPGRLLLFTDFERLTETLKKELAAHAGRKVSIDELAPDIRTYYELRSRRDFSATPSYILDQKKKHTSWKLGIPWRRVERSIRDGSFARKVPRFFLWLMWERVPFLLIKLYTHLSIPGIPDLKKEYKALEQTPQFEKPFVYFPLQKQPEKTTSPQGGVFVDQLLALEIISASVPPGVVIYVKEHPLQWLHFGIRFNSTRYLGYYARIAKIKNIVLIPLATDSYRMINESIATCAVTGSAGWEAALRGKPAMIFGKVWYEDCPGIFKVAGAHDCAEAMRMIMGGYRPDAGVIRNYLKCFESVTVRAFIAQTSGRASTVSALECMENLSAFIVKELEK
ncbi:MAG: capsular polysaccharide biosynthesis protein [Parcubacteria group bacterium Greene0416_79]|nr:MAG: capsular polysaccharide biosynthesis protein [Parcubacteria group bacterium Greene0416_79]